MRAPATCPLVAILKGHNASPDLAGWGKDRWLKRHEARWHLTAPRFGPGNLLCAPAGRAQVQPLRCLQRVGVSVGFCGEDVKGLRLVRA